MESCETSGIEVSDHFREITKMVPLGSGAHRNVKDYMLTRYACYICKSKNEDGQVLEQRIISHRQLTGYVGETLYLKSINNEYKLDIKQ